MVDFKENEQLNTLNHSCAHVMAQAIKHLYPQAKFWVGPVVAEGFYYDVDLGDDVIKDEEIAKIEKEMKKICKDGKRIVRREISKEEALEMFKDDEYKLDLISNLKDGTITCYSQGDFTDLCRGPHVETVKMCKNFKLIKHSGAYWKGDKNNKVLQRIYGVCFPTAEELEEHLNLLEEAKEKGYAEADPTSDIEGYDAQYKLAILSALSFGTKISVYCNNSDGTGSIGAGFISTTQSFSFAFSAAYNTVSIGISNCSSKISAHFIISRFASINSVVHSALAPCDRIILLSPPHTVIMAIPLFV